MQIGERSLHKQWNISALGEDRVLDQLASLRDEMLAQAINMGKIERVQARRTGRSNSERRRSIETKLMLEEIAGRVMKRAEQEGIYAGPAMREELENSIRMNSYRLDKQVIWKEAIEQASYGLGVHPGLALILRETPLGDTTLPLSTLIERLELSGKRRMRGIEARKKEQKAHEDFHLAYAYFDALIAALRKQVTHVSSRDKGLRGGLLYDIALDVAASLDGKMASDFVEPDAFGRSYGEVALDFMRHDSHLAGASMVRENATKPETGGALVMLQQALLDARRKSEMKLEIYR